MSITSILSGVEHAAFSHRTGSASASGELQKLFSKLHLDAIATQTGAATSAAASGTTTSGATGLVAELRHIFDGGMTAVKDARSVAKAVSGYAHGRNLGNLAAQALDKLA